MSPAEGEGRPCFNGKEEKEKEGVLGRIPHRKPVEKEKVGQEYAAENRRKGKYFRPKKRLLRVSKGKRSKKRGLVRGTFRRGEKEERLPGPSRPSRKGKKERREEDNRTTSKKITADGGPSEASREGKKVFEWGKRGKRKSYHLNGENGLVIRKKGKKGV